MFEHKISTSLSLPILLIDSDGAPEAGLVAADVSAAISKGDNSTPAAITVTGNWTELSASEFSGQGCYRLAVSSGDLGVLGPTVIIVTTANSVQRIVFNIVTNLTSDVYTDVATLLTRLTSTRAGYLDNLTNLDAAISGRASATNLTIAQADLTSLVGRLTSARAGYLDLLNTYLDATVSTRATAANLATLSSDVADVAADAEKARQWATNKRLLDIDTGIETTYEDDGTTPAWTRTQKDSEGALPTYTPTSVFEMDP